MDRMRKCLAIVACGLALALTGCGGGGGSGSSGGGGDTGGGTSSASGYVYTNSGSNSVATRAAGSPGTMTVTRDRLSDGRFRPVQGATVSAQGHPGQAVTGPDGSFQLPGLSAGEVELYIVPPSNENLQPINVVHVVGNRPGHGPGGHRPVPMPGRDLIVVPRGVVMNEGDAVQFFAYTFVLDQGLVDISDQVAWRVVTRDDQQVGDISATGLFTATGIGKARIDAILDATASGTGTNSRQNTGGGSPGEPGTPPHDPNDPTMPGDPDRPPSTDVDAGRYAAHAYVRVVPVRTAIEGTVTGQNDAGVRGALVFASGVRDFAVTNHHGHYHIPRVQPDTALEVTVIYEGAVVASQTVTVAEGQTATVDFKTDIVVQPPPDRPVEAVGLLEKPDATSWQYGTHVLRVNVVPGGIGGGGGPQPLAGGRQQDGGPRPPEILPPEFVLALQSGSDSVNLDHYVGQFVKIRGTLVSGYPVDGGPPLVSVTAVRALAEAVSDAGDLRPPDPPTATLAP